MRRATLVLLAGAVCGAGATWLLVDTRPAATAGDTSFLGTLAGFASRGAARNTERVDVTARLAAYRSAAAQDEPAAIEASLARAARAERSAARDLEIDALLSRLGELDAALAARTAQRLELDARFVADAWVTWAEQDADAALAALETLSTPNSRRAAALALLDVVGSSRSAIERVATALPARDRASFEIAALEHNAERDPYGAFRDALASRDAGTRQRAAQEVAVVWAGIDPDEAFAEVSLAPNDVRQTLQQAVAAEWARLDPSGYLRALPSLDLATVSSGVQLVLASDPEGVIRAMEGVQTQIAMSLRTAALAALAQTDIEAAKARVAALPPGQERDQALQQVASVYGRTDPDAALAWAESMGASSSSTIQRSIMLGIASSGDIERALRLVESGASGVDADLVATLVASRATQDPREARKVANELVGKQDAQSKAMLARVVSAWVQREPDAALEWALSQGAAVDVNTIGNMARTFATRDGAAAAAYTDRLPPQLRSAWLAQVAGPYGRADPTNALRWLERYQGQAGYDVALRQMATQAAQTDARAAAAMLERASPDVQFGAAPTVASNWARNEPEAATRWAVTLTDPRARASALSTAAAAWASADVSAAESWALSLARGAARDDALAALLPRRAAVGDPVDGSVLAAFSSAEARQNAIMRVLPALRTRNPAEARRLIETYVTDPVERQRLEQQFPSSAGALPQTLVDPSGNVIVIR